MDTLNYNVEMISGIDRYPTHLCSELHQCFPQITDTQTSYHHFQLPRKMIRQRLTFQCLIMTKCVSSSVCSAESQLRYWLFIFCRY